MDEHSPGSHKKTIGKPEWLRVKLPNTSDYSYLKNRLARHKLHTICESGHCPNQGECWAARTATFMILGDVCTRNCRFCNVNSGKPLPPDPEEPLRIAEAAQELGLRHCVLTSVTRDDLEDGGADIWAATIREVKRMNPGCTLEALIPDFAGHSADIQQVIDAQPDIVSHNIETVERMTPLIRIKAGYRRSLEVIRFIASSGTRTKSGLMTGLGETDREVHETILDLADAGCQVLTIGQYLQPSAQHHPVHRYVHPRIFEKYRLRALEAGFSEVESAPLVRSSYHSVNHL